jgi:hypothetical protein
MMRFERVREHKVADLFFIQKKNQRKKELGFGEES